MSNNTLLITLAQPKPDETKTFHRYVGASTELAVEAGGEVSSRFGVRHIHGDAPAAIFGFATFPSADAITDMFGSDAYQALVPEREKSIECVNVYIVDDTPATALPDPQGVYLVTVATPNPEAMEELAAYQQVAGPLSTKHGGTAVVNLPINGHPIGDTPAAFVGIVEFPSAEAVDAFFADPDYQSSVPARDRALASLNLYVTTG